MKSRWACPSLCMKNTAKKLIKGGLNVKMKCLLLMRFLLTVIEHFYDDVMVILKSYR